MISKEEYWNKIFFQTTLELNKEEIYSCFFSQIVPKLEKNKFYPLFGNIDGSISRGMNNNTSDVDMHVFGETNNDEIIYELISEEGEIKEKNIVFDIAAHSANIAKQRLSEYNKKIKKYPTIFYRSEDEKEIYSMEKIHWNVRYRPDGEIFELLQFLIADSIFIRKKDEKLINMQELYYMYKTVDMMDLQFVRAYGNYNNLIKDNQDAVLVRKYLYTLYEIFFCKWILKYKSRPPLIFLELFKKQDLDKEQQDCILEVFNLNKNAGEHKTKNKCERKPVLNTYIKKSLEQLITEIARYNPEENYLEIINNTEEARKQQIFYF